MNQKYQILLKSLREMKRMAVAFSGGVDSAFLLAAAHDALGENAVAITALAPNFPADETMDAKQFCRRYGIRQIMVTFDPLSVKEFRENDPKRCYYCKKSLFAEILKTAAEEGASYVAEGTNADDSADYRPGMRAIRELGIESPLKEAGFTKREIRALSETMELPTWNKPSRACLASRVPYGEAITKEKLCKVEKAEDCLHRMGFSQIRVRAHESVARIETTEEDMARFLNLAVRREVTDALRAIGFRYIALGLLGYRMGSMNEALWKDETEDQEEE